MNQIHLKISSYVYETSKILMRENSNKEILINWHLSKKWPLIQEFQ
jgi:hypothetical protein